MELHIVFTRSHCILFVWYKVYNTFPAFILVVAYFTMERGRARNRNFRGRGQGRFRARQYYSRSQDTRSGSRTVRHSSFDRPSDFNGAMDKLTSMMEHINNRLDRLEQSDGFRKGGDYRMPAHTHTAPHSDKDRQDRQSTNTLTISVFKYIQMFPYILVKGKGGRSMRNQNQPAQVTSKSSSVDKVQCTGCDKLCVRAECMLQPSTSHLHATTGNENTQPFH